MLCRDLGVLGYNGGLRDRLCWRRWRMCLRSRRLTCVGAIRVHGGHGRPDPRAVGLGSPSRRRRRCRCSGVGSKAPTQHTGEATLALAARRLRSLFVVPGILVVVSVSALCSLVARRATLFKPGQQGALKDGHAHNQTQEEHDADDNQCGLAKQRALGRGR